MVKYVAGIDAGTTGSTVMIFDLEGNLLGTGYREYSCKYPHPGWVEQDMNDLWKGICEASKEVLSKTRVDPKEIGSVGFSSQRGTFVPIDKDWKCLSDAIVWSDGRAGEEIKWIEDNIGREHYHEISGVPLSGLWSYAKYKWVRDNKPALYEKAWKFVNGQEWLLHKFGSSELFTDPASLTLNGMMDVKNLDWSDELLDAIRVDRDKLPPVKTPMTKVGVVSKKASDETGFSVGMPICSGGGDQQCAAIGAGVIREGLSEITIGTAAVMVAHVDNRRVDADHSVLFGGHAIPHKWDMEGLTFGAGVCLRWWRDTYGQPEMETAKKLGMDIYDLITLEAEKAPVGCKGYLFFPFVSSQVSPYYHDNARGGSLGLTLAHDRGMMARAVMEGVIYEIRMIVEAMEKVIGRPFETIRLSGGGAKSDLWCHIQADVYGRPVEKLKVSDCTTLGAAILGAVGAGVFENIEDAVDKMVHTYGFIEPNMKNHEIYTDMYGIFKDTFLALRDTNVYNKLAVVSKKYWG